MCGVISELFQMERTYLNKEKMQTFEKLNILERKIKLISEQIITWRKRFFWLVWFPVIGT